MKCIKTQLAGASKYEDQEDQNTGDGKLSSRQLTDTCLSLSLSLTVCLSLSLSIYCGTMYLELHMFVCCCFHRRCCRGGNNLNLSRSNNQGVGV